MAEWSATVGKRKCSQDRRVDEKPIRKKGPCVQLEPSNSGHHLQFSQLWPDTDAVSQWIPCWKSRNKESGWCFFVCNLTFHYVRPSGGRAGTSFLHCNSNWTEHRPGIQTLCNYELDGSFHMAPHIKSSNYINFRDWYQGVSTRCGRNGVLHMNEVDSAPSVYQVKTQN